MKKSGRRAQLHALRMSDRQERAKITGGGDPGIDLSLAYKALGPNVGRDRAR